MNISIFILTRQKRDLLQKPASSCRFCKNGVVSKDGIYLVVRREKMGIFP
jgi:hypothetical protein